MLARDELRAFLARMLGWRNDVAVELALRSVELAVARETALVLLSPGRCSADRAFASLACP